MLLLQALCTLTLSLATIPLSTAVNVYVYRGPGCSQPAFSAGCTNLGEGACCLPFNATWNSVRFVRRESLAFGWKHKLKEHDVGIAHSPGIAPNVCGEVCNLGRKCVSCVTPIAGVSWGHVSKKFKRGVQVKCEKTVPADFVVVDHHRFSINATVPRNVTEHLKNAVLWERPANELHLSSWHYYIDEPAYDRDITSVP